MNLPAELSSRRVINPKLAVGSSLPKPRELLSWVITLFLVNDCEYKLEYAESTNDHKIKIKQDIFEKVKTFFSSVENYDEDHFDSFQSGKSNPLCHMQLEPLQVSLQLVWKLAKINAIDSSSSSLERKGGVRVPKSLGYTTNLILIENLLKNNNEEVDSHSKKVLYHWIIGSELESEYKYAESKLISTLLVFTEDTLYKDWQDLDAQLVFQLEGLYSNIKNSLDVVGLGRVKEVKGTLRNLKAILESELHPFLEWTNIKDCRNSSKIVLITDDIKKLKFKPKLDLSVVSLAFVEVHNRNFGEVALKKNQLESEYLNYTALVSNFLDLVPRTSLEKVDPQMTISSESNNEDFDPPHQVIFFGSPGTGKSHTIEERTKGASTTRITFHPDTDYQSFVGSYRPNMDGKDIQYKFVPQAFIKAYCHAWLNPNQPHYLIIEEINRGNCAQVFGDIFQCLDRDENGYSKYETEVSTEISDYIKNEFSLSKENIENYLKITKSKTDKYNNIRLPPNFYLFASMNTSDQSLFPMDSAFKRRWSWKHIPINYKDADNFVINISNKSQYSWGEFIRKINPKIRELTGSEDKLLGNRFVNPTNDIIEYQDFVSKVLFYLWDEIYKDEYQTANSIFQYKLKNKDKVIEFTFNELFEENSIQIVESFLEFNEVFPVKSETETETETEKET